MKKFMLLNKKCIWGIMAIAIMISFTGCNSEEKEIEAYRDQLIYQLIDLRVTTSKEILVAQNLSQPHCSENVYYSDYERYVHICALDYLIYLHNLLEVEDITATGAEITNLYYTMDEDATGDMQQLFDWYNGRHIPNKEYCGEEKCIIIETTVEQVYYILYPEKCGESYLKTESISELEYGERIAFIEWILANPDYEFAAEYDEYYKFLDWMGLIPESERREVPGKEEELYGAEIYVAE